MITVTVCMYPSDMNVLAANGMITEMKETLMIGSKTVCVNFLIDKFTRGLTMINRAMNAIIETIILI